MTRALERAVLLLTIVLAGATFWIAPRLPMVDMPQHAGQVALWRDLMAGSSKWQSMVYINYFTPYLLGYSLAFLLSFVMPVAAALKLVLTLAFYAFVATCMLVRRHLDGDRRLDWLFIPGFFGFAYGWGFYTFLVAAPLGMAFIVLALCYAEKSTRLRGAILVLAGLGLFFAHGLVFLFANAIGVTFLLLEVRRSSFGHILRSILPYVALGLCCVSYALIRLPIESEASSGFADIIWGKPLERLKFLAFFPLGTPAADPVLAPLRLLFLAAPLLVRARINLEKPAAFVPFAFVLLVFALMPLGAASTWFLYQRFDVFLLPFYALLFRCGDAVPAWAASSSIPVKAARLWPSLLCWYFIVIHVGRLLAFSKESAAFDEVLASMQPEERALSLVFEPGSAAMRNPFVYFNFPVWYQAEKRGFVDFNAARFLPQIVRFRRGQEPVDTTDAGWSAGHFDWTRSHAENYRYFIVRNSHALPDGYFPGDRCKPVLAKAAGNWSIFENVNCHAPHVR